MKRVMIGLIRLYQKYLSPLKPPCCRFTPTCSAYAIEAFQKRGFFVGLALSVWRILRCNPFSKGGYDPVPERGARRKRKANKEEWEEDKVRHTEDCECVNKDEIQHTETEKENNQ